jgi:hypothetical protein
VSRLFDFRCRTCGAERTVEDDRDRGDRLTILCAGCRAAAPVSWWRSRPPEAFVAPDTAGMTFGPSPSELAELGRPNTRVRDDYEGMAMKPDAPEMNRDAKKQMKLL